MKLIAAILIAAVGGIGVAWYANQQNYVRRDARFGVLDLDGDVTVANLEEHVKLEGEGILAKVELPDGHVHDFGTMAPDAKGEHSFVVRNAGSTPLSLEIGGSSCKCTVGTLEEDALGPGESTTVKMEWTVRTVADEFEQHADLITNDPDRPEVRLRIKGRVVRDVEVVPKAWSFGEVASGDPIEITAKVYNYLGHDVVLEQPTFSGSEFAPLAEFQVESFEPTEASDGAYQDARQGFQVIAKVKPGLPQGSVRDEVRLRLVPVGEAESGGGEPEAKTVTVPVAGRVVGPLGIIRNSRLKQFEDSGYVYELGRLEEEEDLEAKALVTLKGSERENTTLRVGEVSPEGVVEASLGEPMTRGSMRLQTLTIRFRPGDEPVDRLGRNRNEVGWIWIESDNPDVPRMRLTLKFALPAR
jgi:hypothetical protein